MYGLLGNLICGDAALRKLGGSNGKIHKLVGRYAFRRQLQRCNGVVAQMAGDNGAVRDGGFGNAVRCKMLRNQAALRNMSLIYRLFSQVPGRNGLNGDMV